MKGLTFCIILCTLIGCQNTAVRQVKYKYLESPVSDYKFSAEINYYFDKTKDIAMAATDYSFVSEHEKLLNTLISNDTIIPISEIYLSQINEEYTKVNAKDFIVNQSKEHDFILINESHYIPQHRNFVSYILPALSKTGYCNLALEGLNHAARIDNDIRKNGYPELSHGLYVKEPELANLIREAHRLGFNIFGYDEGSGVDREILSAKNILKKIDSFEKKGKTIVLCGWDHIKEGPTGTYWDYALAGRIKEFTETDPLTINQTQYSEKATIYFEDSLYQSVQIEEPTILIDESDQSIDLESNQEWYDIFVFHPRTVFVETIPKWMLTEKKIYEFYLPELDIKYPCKVMLFETGDNIQNAIPTYIVELANQQKTIKMPVYQNKEYKILIANTEIAYLID